MNKRPNSVFMLIAILHIQGLYKVSIDSTQQTDSMVQKLDHPEQRILLKVSSQNNARFIGRCYIFRLKREVYEKGVLSGVISKTIIGLLTRVKFNNSMKGVLRQNHSCACARHNFPLCRTLISGLTFRNTSDGQIRVKLSKQPGIKKTQYEYNKRVSGFFHNVEFMQ